MGDGRWGSRKILHLKDFQLRPGCQQRGRVHGEFILGDEHVNAAVAQDVIHLVRLEKIVDGHQHGARAQNAEDRWNEFRAVF